MTRPEAHSGSADGPNPSNDLEQAGPSLVPLATTLIVGAFAALLDTTVVAVAIDTLGRDLQADITVIQWVTTSYLLAMAAVIPVVGWLVDRFGARAIWSGALGLFLAGSVLSGLAWSAGALIAFRVLQGLGGGMILPLTQLVLARAAGPQRFGRVMGVVGLVGQLAPISGPVLGGLLIDTWGWRWIFFVNVPIVVVSLLMTTRWFPREDPRTERSLDVVGLVLLPTGIVAMIYALSNVESGSTVVSAQVLVAALVGVALLAAFVLRPTTPGRPSLIDLRLFGDRSFRGGSVMLFVFGVTSWGPMFVLPLYYQQLRGLSALDAGFALAPQSVGLGLAYLATGRYADRLAPRPLVAGGLVVASAGTLPFVFATADSNLTLLGISLFVRGIGFGAASLPASAAVYRTLRTADIPGATSASNVIQRVGAATGTAVMALILQADGFTPALTWMFVLTSGALAGTVFLPGQKPAPAPRDTVPTTTATGAQ
ncbi:hypothetical protein CcI6DRAFT_04804 [Frankia sp. CcI6]|uniref:DHA2 family efflux MFS transporter permease subunit n=1 Tax=unclassified Frankia TaxID=2632575 RepID=UPI0003CFBB3D|nr:MULTISPECIES: DHA2 family efflux MFS transporter permease subunit [unclassified Frankia]ESZ99787.1 hypothetical protein CcI6DRAFT_04804 [Frankia sp. CcI6]KDA40493.1 hypothetical protein BMG523Draft_04699 [Frankia sp. BMG5.23]KFB02508.1 drug resistance transporter, EmrB/QacA subfamily [Frankia sp. Allo2]OHV47802.1 multidrug MFS transporter [Frankia sp. CgIS1]